MSAQEQLQASIDELGELISQTRSRIVQSPDRLKRKISDMAATVAEDKRTFALHESKIRDLQMKSAALIAIEKVRVQMPCACIRSVYSVARRMCARATSSCKPSRKRCSCWKTPRRRSRICETS